VPQLLGLTPAGHFGGLPAPPNLNPKWLCVRVHLRVCLGVRGQSYTTWAECTGALTTQKCPNRGCSSKEGGEEWCAGRVDLNPQWFCVRGHLGGCLGVCGQSCTTWAACTWGPNDSKVRGCTCFPFFMQGPPRPRVFFWRVIPTLGRHRQCSVAMHGPQILSKTNSTRLIFPHEHAPTCSSLAILKKTNPDSAGLCRVARCCYD
jgi:hypothetical protein